MFQNTMDMRSGNDKDEKCPCKKENCPRHGDCEACRTHCANSQPKRQVACEGRGKSVHKRLFFIVLVLIAIQSLFLAIKLTVFSFATETFYSRSMVTMASMAAVFVVMVLYCRRRHFAFSALPATFGLPYIIATAVAVVFYFITLFFVNELSVQNVLILIYGSFVTPVFEELLFRGVIWNRLKKCFSKKWMTYLVVTALFALWHVGYAVGIYLWTGGDLLNCILMKVIVGAVFGLIMGGLRYKTKNCYLGILVHGVLNALG